MQATAPQTTATRRRWLRYLGGAITTSILLAVPAFALSFTDLGAFTALTHEPSVVAVEPSDATPARQAANQPTGARTHGQGGTLVLTDWTYLNGDGRGDDGRHCRDRTRPKHTKTRHTHTRTHFRHDDDDNQGDNDNQGGNGNHGGNGNQGGNGQ
jgi:hypothetical protein